VFQDRRVYTRLTLGSGQPARASGAFQRLSETTRASGTDWALGTEQSGNLAAPVRVFVAAAVPS
jgi:hypothetical protein